MAASGPPQPQSAIFSPPTLHRLRHVLNILHLFHHRNRNQHRRAPWYRHFGTFRRQLARLVADLDALHAVPATHVARQRKRRGDGEVKGRVERRVGVWREVYVGRWWRAFSQVVGEGRFAVLGVVLVGVLGEVCGVLGLLEGGMLGEEMEGTVLGRLDCGREGRVSDGVGRGDDAAGEDVGVAVQRDEGEDEGEDEDAARQSPDRGGAEAADATALSTPDTFQPNDALHERSRTSNPAKTPATAPDSRTDPPSPLHRPHATEEAPKLPSAAQTETETEQISRRTSATQPSAPKPTRKLASRGKGEGKTKGTGKKAKANAIDALFRGL